MVVSSPLVREPELCTLLLRVAHCPTGLSLVGLPGIEIFETREPTER
jgi:hypothetical protein